MWDLTRPGLEPVSPALAGGFLTTAPPGKPQRNTFLISILYLQKDKENRERGGRNVAGHPPPPPECSERPQPTEWVRLLSPAITDNSNGPKASVNKVSLFGESQMICPVHVHEEEVPGQSIEALALHRLGPFSWKFWAALSRAHRGHRDNARENPYGPQGPAADNRVGGRET